jgi:tetratricopeptide (TPR) repeat protein
MSEDSLKKINEIDPNSVVAHEITGEIDESMHNYDVALVEYKKAIELAPHQPGTHMHMGNDYWLIGKWASAQEEFKAELENDPYNCTARWKLANSMLEANDSSEDALAQLNQAVDRCPGLMQARVDRARALVRRGKQSDALPDLLPAEKDSPTEPSIHFLPASNFCSDRCTGRRERLKRRSRKCVPMRSCKGTRAQPLRHKPTGLVTLRMLRTEVNWRIAGCTFAPILLCSPASGVQQPSDPLASERAELADNHFTQAADGLRNYLKAHANSADAHFLLGYVLFREKKAVDSLAEFTAGAKFRRPRAG